MVGSQDGGGQGGVGWGGGGGGVSGTKEREKGGKGSLERRVGLVGAQEGEITWGSYYSSFNKESPRASRK